MKISFFKLMDETAPIKWCWGGNQLEIVEAYKLC